MKKTTQTTTLSRATCATLALAFLGGATAHAGIKYWDNPEYKAFDVGDYVQGAVWNFDGIRNAGADQLHSYATTTWKNLGSSGADNDVWVRYQKSGGGWSNSSAPANLNPVGGKNLGSWTENGFTFTGDSEWRASGSGSVAKIESGTNYTIQALVDATVSGQTYNKAYVMSVQQAHFAFYTDKAKSRLYWGTQTGTQSDHPFMSGNDLGYMTAILNGTDKTATFFSGTEAPTSGDGFRQFASVSGKTDNGYCLCGYTGNDGQFVGTINFYRYYKRVLSNEELAWNRVVDEARYFSRVAPLPVTNAVVATSVAGANGTEPAGCYAVDGRHTFIAPATVTVGGIDYICTGYTVETREGDGWSEPVFHKAAIFQPCAFVVTEGDCVRLTWQWAKAAGLANLGYDVGDYVWDDLVLFYDGICNVGTNQPHSYAATTWKNLGSAGATNDMFLQLLNAGGTAWTKPSNFSIVGERDPGAWTESGFALKGDSRFRVVSTGGTTGAMDVGTDYSLQMLLDANAADQTTTYAFPFSLSANKLSFVLYKSGSIAWRNDNDGYQVGGNNPLILSGASFDYLTAIVNGTANTTAFFTGTEIPTSGGGFRQYESITDHGLERGYDLGGYGNASYDYLLVGTIKSFRQYNRVLTAAEVAQNRKVDNWRYFGIPDNPNVIVQSTVPYLRGDEPDGPYAVDGSHVFAAPASVTAKGITYECDGYTVETWDGSAWSNAVSGDSNSYAYNTSAGLVRLTWKWKATRGLRTANDYSYDDYSQAGLYWHYDGLLNQGVGKTRSTAADAKWINLGSSGAKYDLSKYRANNSTPDGEWTADGYLFRGGTRYRASGVPIGPFKSFTLQMLVDADMTNQPAGKACYIMSGIWDYFAIVLGNKNDTYNGVLYGNFQGLGTGTGNKHATVYFKNDSGHYDYATSIMDYDAKTAQVFDGVEPPTSGTGFHQLSSVTSRSDSGFGLGNSGGDGTEALVGTFKSFRYYDRVLTEEEIVRNRNVDSVRYFGALGVTNVLVTTRFAAGGEQAENGAYKVEGSWDFTATTVLDASGSEVPVAGYYTETLDGGVWTDKTWHEGTTYSYGEGTTPATVRLTWAGPPAALTIMMR